MGRLQNIPPLEPGRKFFLADPRAPKRSRIFDIGCGVGNFMAAARGQGYDVTGIDWDTKGIQTGKEILGLERVFPLSIEEYADKNSGETFDAVSFFEVARHYDGPRLSVRNLSRGFTQILGTSSSIQDFIDTVNNAQKTFETSARQLESGSIDGLAQVRTDVTKSIDQLRRIPSLAVRPDELAAQLRQVMQDQYELIQDVERAGTVTLAHSRRLKENSNRYEEVMATFLKWVETDGPKYGIQTGKRR